jgi:hypothetical protein
LYSRQIQPTLAMHIKGKALGVCSMETVKVVLKFNGAISVLQSLLVLIVGLKVHFFLSICFSEAENTCMHVRVPSARNPSNSTRGLENCYGGVDIKAQEKDKEQNKNNANYPVF